MSYADYLIFAAQFLICILAVAFFSAFESSFGAMNKVKFRHKLTQKVYGADFIELLYNNREKFLGFTLVGMTLAFIAGIVIAVEFLSVALPGSLQMKWLGPLAALVTVPIMLMFGELLPRVLARRHADRAVFLLVKPVMFTYAFFYVPLVIFTSAVTKSFMWLLGTERSGLELRATKEELRLLVRLGEKSGIVEEGEGALIEGIFDFQGKTAAECLRPRVDIEALSKDVSIAQVAQFMLDTGKSRIPLFDGSLDTIVGIVHSFDILTTKKGMEEKAKALLKPVPSIPENKSISVLLREFQAGNPQMAIVVGEYGETVGLITMEDILEEIVGEIRDEYDEEDSSILMVSPSVYLIDARVSRSEFERHFKTRLPEGIYDTFGGFLLHLWRRIPRTGEEKQYGGMSISIVRADIHRVHQARVIELPNQALASGQETKLTKKDSDS